MKRLLLFLAALLAWFALGPSPALAGKIYWTAGNKIQRANLDGTQLEDVVTWDFAGFHGIALDTTGAKMYWADGVSGTILRAALDGTGTEDVVTGLRDPYGVALDLGAGKLYWTDFDAGKIQRANLDGTDVQNVTGLLDALSIVIDSHGERFYSVAWTVGGWGLWRGRLDGSGLSEILASPVLPEGIALLDPGDKLYWTDSGEAGRILRANLDGTAIETLATGRSWPMGITVDPVQGKMYWAETGSIWRASFDGTAAEALVAGLNPFPYGVAIVPEPSVLALATTALLLLLVIVVSTRLPMSRMR